MSLAEKIAREVNAEFLRRGGNPKILSELFDEAISRRSLNADESARVRTEASRIAVKLRLELLKEARGA